MKIQPHPKHFPTKPAFTLLELLVVILIIAVLASISFLMLRKMQESASAAVDANEMREISAAVILFASDHNDLLPITSGGISPTYRDAARDLKTELYPYFGDSDPKEGDFMPEFAAASWQKETKASNGFGPSLLVIDKVYTGPGKQSSIKNPDPYIQPFGYPYSPSKRAPMTLSAAMSKMTNPANSLMLVEIDQLLPILGNPGWISTVPDKMAHGSYRLGLYWDGHVGRLGVNMDPL